MGRSTAFAGLAILIVTACGGVDETEPAEPPPGVSVTLNQYRANQVAHKIQVAVRNDGPGDVYFKDVQLVSDSFETVPPTQIEEALPRTPRVDLPIDYGTARCNATAIPEVKPATVVAHVGADDTSTQEVRFRINHPDPLLRQIVTNDCGAYIIKQAIDARLGDTWTITKAAGEDVLRGTVIIKRTGGTHPVLIKEVRANPHYNIRPADRKLPIIVPPGSADLILPVDITPSRCDLHSFADAKRAHLYALYAQIGEGEPHELPFQSAGQVKATIDLFARKSCGITP